MATWKLVVFIWYAETYTYFDWFFPINMYVYDAAIPKILLIYHIIKTFVNHSSPSSDLQTFPCSPYRPRGLLRRYTDKKCIIYLKCLWITLLQVVVYKLFPCSPYSPRGLLRRYTDKKVYHIRKTFVNHSSPSSDLETFSVFSLQPSWVITPVHR